MEALQFVIIGILGMLSLFAVMFHLPFYFAVDVDDDHRAILGFVTILTLVGWLIVWAFI